MKCLLESFISSKIEALISSWTAVNKEILIRILQLFLNIIIDRW